FRRGRSSLRGYRHSGRGSSLHNRRCPTSPCPGPGARAHEGRDLSAPGRRISAGRRRMITIRGALAIGLAAFGIATTEAATPFLSAGESHVLAVKADGSVRAWGSDISGELGVGRTVVSGTPAAVPGIANVTAVSGGFLHGLALTADCDVWAWGGNGQGQLGDGSNTDRSSPSRVPGLPRIVAIAAGYEHSLAVDADGRLWG